MESTSTPETVFQQVEALFSAIQSLPESVRSQALKSIHSKLGIAEPTQSTPTDNSIEISTNAETDSQVYVSDNTDKPQNERAKRKRVVTPAAKTRIITRSSSQPKKTSGAASSTKRKSVAATDKSSSTKRQSDQDKLNGNNNSGQSVAVTETVVGDKTSDGDGNDEQGGGGGAVDQQVDRSEGVLLAPNDPFRVHVYRVPKDINTRDFIKNINETTRELGDTKRKKGMKTLYGCIVCTRKFHSKSLVFIHMRKHTGLRPHKCDQCDKSFSQLGGLTMHQKRHQGIFKFNCQYCEYKTLLKVDMMRHEARHRNERNYFCEVCGKSFATEPGLRQHNQNVHQEHQNYVCQICGFVTHQAANLKRHIDVRHSNKECLQCPVCDDVIKQKSSFITHMRTHTQERPFSCRHCNKTFKNHSQVAAHTRTHQEGQFSCTECSRVFKTKFHLKRHSVIHTGIKPYSCSHCSYSCNVKGNINKHVKMVHGFLQADHKSTAAAARRQMTANRLPEDQAELREKGAALAKEFLTNMSMRKSEQLTVEALQQDLEKRKRQERDKAEKEVIGARRKRRTNGQRTKRRNHDDDDMEDDEDDYHEDLDDPEEGLDITDDSEPGAEEEEAVTTAFKPNTPRIEFCANPEQQQHMMEQNLQIALLSGMGERVRPVNSQPEVDVKKMVVMQDQQKGGMQLALLDDGEDSTGTLGSDVNHIFIPNNFICVEPETGEARGVLVPGEGTVYVIRCDGQTN